MPGVIDFVDWKDIPAENNVQLFSWMVATAPKKELFATTKITHVGQVIGCICADTPEQARRAAKYMRFKSIYLFIFKTEKATLHNRYSNV